MSALTKLSVTDSSAAARPGPTSRATTVAKMARKRGRRAFTSFTWPIWQIACPFVTYGAAGWGMIAWGPAGPGGPENAIHLNPLGGLAPSKGQVTTAIGEKHMPFCATRVARGRVSLPAAALASVLLVAAALWGIKAYAADPPSKPAAETTVKVKAFPPSVVVDATGADAKDESADSSDSGRRGSARVHIDADDDFEATIEKMPWIIGLIFLVVGSIFLTPIVLVVGIVWYKLRKARLQNEAMLALAERGVVPPAQAADALAGGVPPAAAAPHVYQQAI